MAESAWDSEENIGKKRRKRREDSHLNSYI